MPLYEYLCASCNHRFEKIRKFSDPPLTECPTCGGPVEKQISSPAIQFKGSGWYINDYASPGKNEKGEKAEKGEKSETKSDAAAATPTDKSPAASSEPKAEKSASADASPKATAASPTSDKK